MTESTCLRGPDLSAEVALGVVTGRERAQALSHLEQCRDCRHEVTRLSSTADRLLDLIPDAESPADFEQRVLGALDRASRSDRPLRRSITQLAAAVAVALLVAGGWMSTRPAPAANTTIDTADADVRTVLYAPLLADQHHIGSAYLHPGRPGWIHLSLDAAAIRPGNTIQFNVTHSDGTQQSLGTLAGLAQGQWSAPIPPDVAPITKATLTDPDGKPLGVARFAQSGNSPNQVSGKHHHGRQEQSGDTTEHGTHPDEQHDPHADGHHSDQHPDGKHPDDQHSRKSHLDQSDPIRQDPSRSRDR